MAEVESAQDARTVTPHAAGDGTGVSRRSRWHWLGLPERPGVLVFFTSTALSHHYLLDVVRGAQPDQLVPETVEAMLIGVIATAAFFQLVRVLRPGPRRVAARGLSLALIPAVLFIPAPFGYQRTCRAVQDCEFWHEPLLVIGAILCAAVAVYTWSGTIKDRMERLAVAARSPLSRLSPTALFFLAWVLCTLLIAWRGYDRLTQPELFAEGGRQYVSQALSHGWFSLFILYDDVLHIIPRLIALTAVTFSPVQYVPAVTVTACYLLAGAVSAFIVRPVFRWLIPSDAFRLLAAVMLCLVPGLREVLGNLSNLHYLLFLLVALLALKDPARPYRAWELGAALLATLSSSLAAALAPVAAVRLWLKIRRGPRPTVPGFLRSELPEVAFALIVAAPKIVLTLGLIAGSWATQELYLDRIDPVVVLQAWGTVLTSIFLVNPFAGPAITTEIVHVFPQWMLLLVSAAVFLLLFRVLRRRECADQRTVLFAWLTVPFTIIALIAVARSPTLKPFLLDEAWEHFSWWMRYNYLFVAFSVVIWLALTRPTRFLPAGRHANVVALTLCVAFVSQSGRYFSIDNYGEERYWNRTSAALERSMRTGCPRSVKVRTYPGDWYFVYDARKEAAACGDSAD